MRILVCASEAPVPPLNGARLALRELCARLAPRHDVCVVAYRWPGQEGAAPDGVELRALDGPWPGRLRRTADRVVSVARREPTEVPRLGPPMGRAVAALRAEREFDVAHVTLGVLAGVAGALDGLPAVIAPLDAWSLNVATDAATAAGVRRGWLTLQHRLVARYVAHAYRPFVRAVLVTPEDARETERLDPLARTAVIPNGVDADHFRPDPGARRAAGPVLFTGDLASPANVDAARHLAERILPRLRARRPAAEVALVGRHPAPSVRALGRRPGVRVVADAPDLQPWLAAAGVFACPMTTGTGIKNKLLEALACGAPAVATPLACRGLAVRDGQQLLVADSHDAFAAGVLRLLDEPELAARLGAAARRFAVERHDWGDVARRYEALYADAMAEAGPP